MAENNRIISWQERQNSSDLTKREEIEDKIIRKLAMTISICDEGTVERPKFRNERKSPRVQT